jgi:hypothetical protein
MSDVDQDKIDTKPPPSRQKSASEWSWPRVIVTGVSTGLLVAGGILAKIPVGLILFSVGYGGAILALTWSRR